MGNTAELHTQSRKPSNMRCIAPLPQQLYKKCNYFVQEHQALPVLPAFLYSLICKKESNLPLPTEFRKLSSVFERLAFISWRQLMLNTRWKITTKITIFAWPLGLQSNRTYCTENLPADITTGCFCDKCKDWFKAVILHILCAFYKGEGY